MPTDQPQGHPVFSITLLPANEGDCIWIEYGDSRDPFRILIDGGRKSTYPRVRARILDLPKNKRRFELLVVSHVDRDHIEGVVELLRDDSTGICIGDVWFNGYKQIAGIGDESFGVVQGEVLSAFLEHDKRPWNRAFGGHAVVCPTEGPLPRVHLAGGLEVIVLSPTRGNLQRLLSEWEEVCRRCGLVPGEAFEVVDDGPAESELEVFGALNVNELSAREFVPDRATANGSSIALLVSFHGKRVLLAGDAHDEVLLSSISKLTSNGQPLRADAVKASHHGSSRNTSVALASALQNCAWLFSSSGACFGHPAKETVARVVKFSKPRLLVFNYRTENTTIWESEYLSQTWMYQTRYAPAATPGEVTLNLIG